MRDQNLKILLLEDEPHDVFFIKRALEQVAKGHVLRSVENGEEAIQYLRGEGQFADREAFPFPNLILTDLKMPRMNGFEFLEWIRHHQDCSVIPTIVLSSSAIESDVRRAYEIGANAYVRKPASMEDLVKMIKLTWEYWQMCERPTTEPKC